MVICQRKRERKKCKILVAMFTVKLTDNCLFRSLRVFWFARIFKIKTYSKIKGIKCNAQSQANKYQILDLTFICVFEKISYSVVSL